MLISAPIRPAIGDAAAKGARSIGYRKSEGVSIAGESETVQVQLRKLFAPALYPLTTGNVVADVSRGEKGGVGQDLRVSRGGLREDIGHDVPLDQGSETGTTLELRFVTACLPLSLVQAI